MFDKQDHPIDIELHILCLLYTDDIALLSATAADLQYALNIFYKYCNNWKIVIFNGTSRDYKRTII